jgi:hypothetical protein
MLLSWVFSRSNELEKVKLRMHIQWCLKGIPEYPGFSDSEAIALLNSGLPSNWVRQNATRQLAAGLIDGQQALSETALFDHVNDYARVGTTTPYVSLSAGVVQPGGTFGFAPYPAWYTAADFATQGPTGEGFIYRVWTVVAPKVSASLMNVSDEVRDLNIFRHFWRYNREGEVAAKLLVPYTQIQYVAKLNSQLDIIWQFRNRQFVQPESISNLLEETS